tara:strand:- start:53 stop:235 length:183 start_codon:yes stop_codon:yes gene_type:complete
VKKISLKDDFGKTVEVEIEKFIDHIKRFHGKGTSIHDEKGHYFTVNDEFRKKLEKFKKQC